jgi:hypothetical protein
MHVNIHLRSIPSIEIKPRSAQMKQWEENKRVVQLDMVDCLPKKEHLKKQQIARQQKHCISKPR